jgi:hypothetical protein
LREPGGRPGPGRLGLGARAGSRVVGRMFRKRRTRCHDCNVVRGSVHHPHCIEAWCITCDKKRFFCSWDDGVAIIG